MAKGILGKKLGMTQVFDPSGVSIPVTVIEAGPCPVVQQKRVETDGYNSMQVGFGATSAQRITKPLQGHFEKSKVTPHKYLREFRIEDESELAPVGSQIKVDIFSEGDHVDISATSKGKGFAGTVKRHNFNRGPMSHGSMYHRRVGSLGATDPQRVFKGRRMAGRMGGERTTIQNLKVVKVDPERNLLMVRGAVPGAKGTLLVVQKSVKSKE